MKRTPSLAGMVAAFTMALHAGSVPRPNLKSEDWRYGRKRRKKGGGSGGAGVITRKGPITRPPEGYWLNSSARTGNHCQMSLRKREQANRRKAKVSLTKGYDE